MNKICCVLLAVLFCGCTNTSNSSLWIQGASLTYSASVSAIEAVQVKDFLVKKQFFGSSDNGGNGRFLKLQKTLGRLQVAMGFDEITLQNAKTREITKLEFQAIGKVMGDELKQAISVLVCENTFTSCQEF